MGWSDKQYAELDRLLVGSTPHRYPYTAFLMPSRRPWISHRERLRAASSPRLEARLSLPNNPWKEVGR